MKDQMAVEASPIQIALPAMGESVTEGTVLEWHKQEGDHVEADEVLVEISTDKVDAEVPAPTGGTIVRILVAEGDTVQVGAVLAEISTNGAGTPAAAAPEAPEPEAAPQPEAPPQAEAAPQVEAAPQAAAAPQAEA